MQDLWRCDRLKKVLKGQGGTMDSRRFGQILCSRCLKWVLGFLLIPTHTVYSQACEVKVIPPHSVVYDRTVSEWAAEWAKWILTTDANRCPLFDQTGAFAHEGQTQTEAANDPCRDVQGNVFFLVGNMGTSADVVTVREYNIPYGKALFIPIANYTGWVPDDGRNCTEVKRTCQQYGVVDVASINCTIDGQAIPNLWDHEEASECFCIYVEPGDLLDPPSGIWDVVATAGYWIMVEPLCPGAHTIHHVASFTSGNLVVDVIHNINVLCELFNRGDANTDGELNIADAVFILTYLFGDTHLPCEKAADSNDDGQLNIADAITLLSHLFAGQGPLPEPFGEFCGIDLTEDSLTCLDFGLCQAGCE